MTDYPFTTSSPMNELGDDHNQPAPVRKLRIVNFDGDKWCEIELEDGTKCNLKYWNISKPLSYTDVLCSLENVKMFKNHTIVIDLENAKIGCPYCDEWQPFFGTRGGDTQFLCDELLKDHLRRLENEK